MSDDFVAFFFSVRPDSQQTVQPALRGLLIPDKIVLRQAEKGQPFTVPIEGFGGSIFPSAGYTPIYAALIGVAAAAGCGMVRRLHACAVLKQYAGREDEQTVTDQPEDEGRTPAEALKKTGLDILKSLENGAHNVIGVAIACGVAGIIVGMITLTGLGLKMGNGLIELAGGH